ncbi:pimeloyl-ACP methyl ester carboxylesterase [Chitinophaga skermanii]|uniref:Pimeloyl-ACP methyl ester carboxylesterase n=1 Tax=Chitinophaga skermanii TaxID=331697 RepID=A0A327QV29_9BACT|nr:alpha/beta hydrolase [Chitinophaga skermanii]RAJ08230.1 pimeloyl-ACP methyl ester carboxylesterase [Chitinophaga skermanii]
MKQFLTRIFIAFSLFLLTASLHTAFAQNKPFIKNVVLVHGAFVDGSGYKGVYDILTKKGYNVTVVQNPLSSLDADVKATQAALDRQDGPTILVGHSYGGTVITEAGDHPNVAALVYIAAFQLDKGESAIDWAKTEPAAPESGILAPDANGILYYDKAKFHAGFCADIPVDQANFMYASQGMFAADALGAKVSKAPWKTKPSYGIVALEDKAILPSIQRKMYARAGAKITEIKASHVVFMSKPQETAAVIMQASQGVK